MVMLTTTKNTTTAKIPLVLNSILSLKLIFNTAINKFLLLYFYV